jgi:hypothetical protein
MHLVKVTRYVSLSDVLVQTHEKGMLVVVSDVLSRQSLSLSLSLSLSECMLGGNSHEIDRFRIVNEIWLLAPIVRRQPTYPFHGSNIQYSPSKI